MNAKNKESLTPLHIAAEKGHIEFVKMLVAYGAKVNILTNKYESPLHLAARNGHCEVAEILAKNGAILDAKNKDKKTPTDLACLNGHEKIAEYITYQKWNHLLWTRESILRIFKFYDSKNYN